LLLGLLLAVLSGAAANSSVATSAPGIAFLTAPTSFWDDPAPPKSKRVYDIIVKFFDRHLGR
jgi:hypothetical protein